MPVHLAVPTASARTAAEARHAADPREATANIVALSSRTEHDTGQPWLSYPHVFLNLHHPDASFRLETYAWQFIYGTPDNPISYEAPDAGEGSPENVAIVHGGRLQQTVRAVRDAMESRRYDGLEYTLKLLHLRSMGFRAVVLDTGNDDASMAIPMSPVPAELADRSVWPLKEFVEILRRKLTPRPPIESDTDHSDTTSFSAAYPSRSSPSTITSTEVETMSISFQALPYITFDIQGGLTPLFIGPAPNAGNVIESQTIFINANLPGLGTPPKPGTGGPGGGQYIEIIVDDLPTTARITTTVPHAVTLEPGSHMLHFMLSAGDGECIKNGGNCVSKVVHIMHKSNPEPSDAGPIIIYNLPRAAHRADEVVLDFGLVNIGVSAPSGTPPGLRYITNYRINVYIDGQLRDVLDYWNAHKVGGLTPGQHTIKLVLRHRAGGELTDKYAQTEERTFQVF